VGTITAENPKAKETTKTSTLMITESCILILIFFISLNL
jgi:hypothetical protein